MQRQVIMRFQFAILCFALSACASAHPATDASVRTAKMSGVALESIEVQRAIQPGSADRLLIREAGLRLEAEDPAATGPRIAQITTDAGGFVERSSTSDGEIEMHVRIPVAQLDSAIARIGRLGDMKSRNESARDVTEESIDVEARLASLTALRDRLRALLSSAANVQDVVAVERELSRVQSEIDSYDNRLQYLRSHVALAQVTVHVSQKRVLGPLGWIVAGAAWIVSKLFVIR